MSDRKMDVAIVGGAAMGAATAYFLALLDPDLRIALIEKDPTFRYAASALSAASIRQQFSTPENISLSRFGLDFLKSMSEAQDEDPSLVLGGYLILADPSRIERARALNAVQTAEGADIRLLDADALAGRFPWLSCDGIALGSFGSGCEGWFDANALLRGLRHGARDRGVELVTGEVTAIALEGNDIRAVHLADGTAIECATIVNAAGTAADKVAAMAGRSLPVEPRKRTIFVLDCPGGPADMPLVCDPSGFWVRPEGTRYLAGMPPAGTEAPSATDDFEPDHDLFESRLWPALAARIPAFETVRVVGAWAGHYEVNTLDWNAVIGRDPDLPGLIYANGFSGHGLQHAPGVGRAIAELIVEGRYRSIDLSCFSFERILEDEPVPEQNLI